MFVAWSLEVFPTLGGCVRICDISRVKRLCASVVVSLEYFLQGQSIAAVL